MSSSLAPSVPSEGVSFYHDSAQLTVPEVLDNFRNWEADSEVSSSLVAVGAIAPYLGATLLAGRKVMTSPYGTLPANSSLRDLAEPAMAALLEIVQLDRDRGDLDGILRTELLVGKFLARRHSEVWHSDNFMWPSVRWTVSFGKGATRGATGRLRRGDTLDCGDFAGQVGNGPTDQLRPIAFPPGTVVRFQNNADIHAGPLGNGARALLQATLEVDY